MKIEALVIVEVDSTRNICILAEEVGLLIRPCDVFVFYVIFIILSFISSLWPLHKAMGHRDWRVHIQVHFPEGAVLRQVQPWRGQAEPFRGRHLR